METRKTGSFLMSQQIRTVAKPHDAGITTRKKLINVIAIPSDNLQYSIESNKHCVCSQSLTTGSHILQAGGLCGQSFLAVLCVPESLGLSPFGEEVYNGY